MIFIILDIRKIIIIFKIVQKIKISNKKLLFQILKFFKMFFFFKIWDKFNYTFYVIYIEIFNFKNKTQKGI